MSSITLLAGAMSGGGRVTRNGDLTVIYLHACSFATTAGESARAHSWARSKNSFGNAQKDRTAFIERFESVLARNGAGIATKGSMPILQGIVRGMRASGMQMEEWSVPYNIDASVEIKRKDTAAVADVIIAPAQQSD